MIGIATDGFWCAGTTVVVPPPPPPASTGGAPAPCPDPPIVTNLDTVTATSDSCG